jgi:hypothetical protein
LIAYDLQGREIGKIATQQNGTDFLGVRSAVPIHSIRIVPNIHIDRDYTLDDFIFLPAPTAQAAHPSKFTAHLARGDLILCKDVALQTGKVQLQGLPGGLPDLTLPVDELLRVNMPQREKQNPGTGLFAELSDGSIVFAPEPREARKMPTFVRRPNLLKDRAGLVGLWTGAFARKTYSPAVGQTVVWSAEDQRWEPITDLRLLEEVALWKKADGAFASAGYRKLPSIWFAPPQTAPVPGSWHVRTSLGEDLVLTRDQPFTGQLSESLRVIWQGQPLLLRAAEIVAVQRVTGK